MRLARRRGAGGGRALVVLGALALLVIAVEAHAGIAWISPRGQLDTSVMAPPLIFAEGEGAASNRYVKDITFSENRTSFTGTIRGKAGADAVNEDVLRLNHQGNASLAVTLRAAQITNPHVEAFVWTLRDGDAIVATLDHRAQSPSASFVVAPGASLAMDVRVDLADGSGKHNARVAFDLHAEAGP